MTPKQIEENFVALLRNKIKSAKSKGILGRFVLFVWKYKSPLVITLASVFSLAWAYNAINSNPASTVGVSYPASVAWEVKQEAMTGASVKKGEVQVFSKRGKVMAKLNLPESIKNNLSKEVAAASTIEPDGFARGHTETAILDTKTGEVEIFDRPDPLPWLRWRTDGFVFAGPGLINGDIGGRVMVVQHLASVKSATFSVVGSLDQPMTTTTIANSNGTGTFIGVGLTIPFQWGK